LPPGETIRAEVEGVVICILRIEKRIYAFQEFCTHRFGPLSEGCVRGTEIECPWHRSRFDVRSGKVVHGPAKVDLKTWPVEVRDGAICVGIARESTATQPELLPKAAQHGH
jgi:nitrite reductase/ring-hydroxylating ferredoxin subunit